DGTLQEAGSIVWRDGSCLGYGRGDAPLQPMYQYVRDVDFCSGALLLTPRALFQQLNGFDERYKPAYYEEVDYCVRLWKLGRHVVHALVGAGHFVTFYPTTSPDGDWASIYAELPEEVEVMIGPGSAGLGDFLRQRRGYYDRILVSRPHNLQILRARLGADWPP